ncbi:MAG: hemolysin III family protein [Tannerellaceae bacterium]|nr:hemolysin III family protein [Tannerellaceae bacterium]
MSTKFYTRQEEIANSVTHGAGIVLGIIAGYILLLAAVQSGNGWATGSVLVYLGGMLFSYITSTCYHACTVENRKALWRKFDHSAIYMHIAGTYAPFTLLVLRDAGAWGWSLFTFNWLAAFTGLYMSFRRLKKHSHIETICFVLMGCSILVAIQPMVRILNEAGLIQALYWLAAGGASYIMGALFYSWTKRPYMHTVFHVFVLLGSICHIYAIYLIL